MDRLHLMHSFTRVVETGSFSAVAREVGTGQPNISRQVAWLEKHLSARLLHRSTRRLTLTPEGERYYAEARRILDAVAEAESNVRGEDAPRGLLRVACPTLLGRSYVLPHIKPILAQFPQMQIDLQIGDRFVDLVEEGMDLAIRIGALKDSALVARRIGSAARICVASVEYLAAHGEPSQPVDLVNHNCIVFTLASAGNVWKFRDSNVSVNGSFRVNTPDGIRDAVLSGMGIAYSPSWLFADALRDGRLKALLVDDLGPLLPIHFIYAANRLVPSRTRVFMDFIATAFARESAFNREVTDL